MSGITPPGRGKPPFVPSRRFPSGLEGRKSYFTTYEIYRKIGGRLSRDEFEKVVNKAVNLEVIAEIHDLLKSSQEVLESKGIFYDDMRVADLEIIAKLWLCRNGAFDLETALDEVAYFQGKDYLSDHVSLAENRLAREKLESLLEQIQRLRIELSGQQTKRSLAESKRMELEESLRAQIDELSAEKAKLEDRLNRLNEMLHETLERIKQRPPNVLQ